MLTINIKIALKNDKFNDHGRIVKFFSGAGISVSSEIYYAPTGLRIKKKGRFCYYTEKNVIAPILLL